MILCEPSPCHSERSVQSTRSRRTCANILRTQKYVRHTGGTRIRYNRSMKRIYDWQEIQRYYDSGNGFRKCQQTFGVTHYSWAKAIQRGKLKLAPTPFADRRRRHDWAKVQAYVDAGFSYKECLVRFGIKAATWATAVKRNELQYNTPTRAIPIEVMFSRRMTRGAIKRRLLETGTFEERCSRCGITEWRGKPLCIHLDHINGVKDDWRLDNLRMLCPNCHSQTPTFSAKNLSNPNRKRAASGL